MGPVAADRVRAVAHWVNLSTPLGLLVAGAGRAQLRRGPNRTWIAEQCRGGLPSAGAFTIGSVVLVPGGRLDDLIRRTPRILDHEQVHVTQWALLGLSFLPSYVVALAWSRFRTGTNHGANIFEVRAGLSEGGYAVAPLRPTPWLRVNGR